MNNGIPVEEPVATEEPAITEDFKLDEEFIGYDEHPGSLEEPEPDEGDFPFDLDGANRAAATGQYENTMFEMWKMYLEGAIHEVSSPLTIPVADGVLRQWPWFKYHDLDAYRSTRKAYLNAALDALFLAYPKDEDVLFRENEQDWLRHKKDYIEVIVRWTRLVNKWTVQWMEIALNKPQKYIQHAVISDIAAMLINPQYGLVENLRNLADFNITDEEGQELARRGSIEDDDE
jgi:hypothetical protein